MQKIRLKGTENSRSRYSISLGNILNEGLYYNATLALQDRNKPHLPRSVSDINIRSTSKKILLSQVQDIAKLYPPKQDLDMLFYDIEEIKE